MARRIAQLLAGGMASLGKPSDSSTCLLFDVACCSLIAVLTFNSSTLPVSETNTDVFLETFPVMQKLLSFAGRMMIKAVITNGRMTDQGTQGSRGYWMRLM